MSVDQITPQEAAAEARTGALLVDVREDDEWAAAHIAGALHIPLGDLGERLAGLDPTRRTIFVCRVGGRSDVAAGIADRAGFAAPANLDGGMRAWDAEGLPMDPADAEVI